SNPLNYSQPQFAGLSYNYREVDVMGVLQAPLFNGVSGQLVGDYVHNLAYNPSRVLSNPNTIPITNYDGGANNTLGPYHSGADAYEIEGSIGNLHPKDPGDWLLTFGYRYIQPDAVIDAFNDYDFHLGGTNAKGYYAQGNYYFAKNSWADIRWFSAGA